MITCMMHATAWEHLGAKKKHDTNQTWNLCIVCRSFS